jgi:hypothetical protein
MRQQHAEARGRASEPRRTAFTVEGKHRCPYGSGKKYKRCCGGAMVRGAGGLHVAQRPALLEAALGDLQGKLQKSYTKAIRGNIAASPKLMPNLKSVGGRLQESAHVAHFIRSANSPALPTIYSVKT